MESRRPVRLVQSEVWLGRAEFETMIGPRVPDPAETATERSAGPRSIEVRPLLGSPRASTVAPLFSPAATVEDDVTVDAKDDALIRLDGLDGHEPTPPASPKWASRVKSHRLWWAAAGAFGLIFVGGAGLVPLLASPSGSPYVTAGKTAPASPPVAVPAPDPASNRLSEPVDFARPVPPAAPKPPAEVTVRSESPAAAPSHTIRSNNHTITQSEHAASTAPAPARQEALDEAYRWWSQADEYGPKVPRWTHYGPEPTPWP